MMSRSNPLDEDAILVDETSMMNALVAAALFRALRTRSSSTQLVLVGDPDQLPPVGPGQVLRAAIQCGYIPVVDLRQIFRQAADSAIVRSAHLLNSGKRPGQALEYLRGELLLLCCCGFLYLVAVMIGWTVLLHIFGLAHMSPVFW